MWVDYLCVVFLWVMVLVGLVILLLFVLFLCGWVGDGLVLDGFLGRVRFCLVGGRVVFFIVCVLEDVFIRLDFLVIISMFFGWVEMIRVVLGGRLSGMDLKESVGVFVIGGVVLGFFGKVVLGRLDVVFNWVFLICMRLLVGSGFLFILGILVMMILGMVFLGLVVFVLVLMGFVFLVFGMFYDRFIFFV